MNIEDESEQMATTIQVTEDLRDELKEMRMHPRETYNDVIERLIEDQREISESLRSEIEEALAEAREKGFISHDEILKELGL